MQRHYHRQESLCKKVRPRTTARQAVLSSWSGTTADQGRYYREPAVLPVGPAVLPPTLAVLPLGPAVLLLGPAVLSLATETAITFAYELRIEQTQACWIQDDKGYPNSDQKS